MFEESSGGSGVNALAIVAIVILVVLAGFFMMKSGMLGGGAEKTVDVNLKVPEVAAPAK